MPAYRIEQTDPDKTELVLQSIERGVPYAKIAREYKISRPTVYELADRHADRIGKFQDRLLKKWQRTADGSIDYLIDAIENREIKPSQIAYVAGIATDKVMQLSGTPTAVVLHEKKMDPNEYAKAIAAAAKSLRQADAIDVANVSSEHDLVMPDEIGESAQKSLVNKETNLELPNSLGAIKTETLKKCT